MELKRQVMTVQEAAKVLGREPQALLRAIARGAIKVSRLYPGAQPRIPITEVERLANGALEQPET